MQLGKVFIAGHKGMVGSAIFRLIKSKNLAEKIFVVDRNDLDLTNQQKTQSYLKKINPDIIFIAAAKVGGILSNNTYPADFIYDNLMIECNLIHAAYLCKVKKILFLGSSCIYPKDMKNDTILEEDLLSGKLELTNEPYSIAKISGIKLCESYNRQYNTDYRSLMPCNLYGPGDNYHLKNSHVIPALISKIHNAKINKLKSLTLWGSGNALREFLHVDDLASACIKIMQIKKNIFDKYAPNQASHINVGSGLDISIKDLSKMICNIVGYKGKIEFDNKNLDGPLKKLLDIKKIISLGWSPEIDFKSGLEQVYLDFQNNDQKSK